MSDRPFGKRSSRYDEASGSDSSSDSGESLIFDPCSSLTSQFDTNGLIETCEDCGRFYARCCMHKGVCHHGRIVFTDGACTNNGAHGSVSGVGIAFGRPQGEPETREPYQFSIRVNNRIDPGGRRTNQRAELLAAIGGLRKICKQDAEEFLEKVEEHGHGVDCLCPDSPEIIITTDSQYVVKGMTEWLPRWRENGFRKANGEPPSNLDLFLDLGAEIQACQYKYGCKVEFWQIGRKYNIIADELAKRAARTA